MKKWLKRSGRWLFSGLGILFIANSVYWVINADAAWKGAVNVIVIAVWIVILYWVSGIEERIVR